MYKERLARTLSGALVLFLLGCLAVMVVAVLTPLGVGPLSVGGGIALAVVVVALAGFTILQPNEALVLTVFGRYTGTLRRAGWWWFNPLAKRQRVSLRLNMLESGILKVNDGDANPVEIGAVITWQVVETARAVFDVQDYAAYVKIQTDVAIRHVASLYPYDAEKDKPSLHANTDVVIQTLSDELARQLERAGIAVIEARLSHLAYAQEIAGAMLRRQQAGAIVAARKQYVEGAINIVQDALHELTTREIVELTSEQKASLASNLLVVLVSEQPTQPVVGIGARVTPVAS